MRKINKNLFIFSLITSFLGISIASIIYKFTPAFFVHTINYCQFLIDSYSIKIPHELSFFISLFILLISFVFLIKVFMTFIKIKTMRNYLIKNEIRVNKVLVLAQKTGLKNKVSVVKDTKSFAFCLGFRKPHIYLSSKTVSIMTTKQLKAILLHEKYHLERADSLILFIGSLPELLFPFLPLIPTFLNRYKIEREIEADKQAVLGLGAKGPVIEVLKIFLENSFVSPSYISSISNTGTLEVRIQSLLDKTTTYPKIKIMDFLISILSLSFIFVSIVVPVQATEIHAKNQDAIMICPENTRCVNQCKNNEGFTNKSDMSHSYTPVR